MIVISSLYFFPDVMAGQLDEVHDAWMLLGLALAGPWPGPGWPLAWPWLALGLALACPWPGPFNSNQFQFKPVQVKTSSSSDQFLFRPVRFERFCSILSLPAT